MLLVVCYVFKLHLLHHIFQPNTFVTQCLVKLKDKLRYKCIMTDHYVYIMSNECLGPNIYKIGWTRKNPEIRAKQLSATSLPKPFKVERVIITDDGPKLEATLHNHFKDFSVSDNREFFEIDKDLLLSSLTDEFNLELLDRVENNDGSEIVKNETKLTNKINK